jgi:hypothetical protein
MSDIIKTPSSIALSDAQPLAIVHAYQSVLNACGARIAKELLDEFEIDAPAVLDPTLYDGFLATTRMLIRYAN